MAHHKSAIKRIRQTKKRRLYNRQNKKAVKYAIRDVREASTYEEALENFKKVTKVLDRAAAKGVLHKNHVARNKSRLYNFINKMKEATEA